MKKFLAACALCGLFATPVLAANAAVDSAVKTFDAVGNDAAKLKIYCEMSKVMSSADAEDDSKAEALDKQMDGFMKAPRPRIPDGLRGGRRPRSGIGGRQDLRCRDGQARRQVRQVSARGSSIVMLRGCLRRRPRLLLRLAPIAERGVDQRQRGHGRRIGAHDARAERDRQRERLLAQQRALRGIEPAFGPDEHGQRHCPRWSASAASGLATSAASSQKISLRFGSHAESKASSFSGSPTVGTRSTPHCSAASMALARMRSRFTRAAMVRRVSTGCRCATPISVAFCTM